MTYDFDKIVNRRGTYSAKWDGANLFNPDVHWNDNTIPMMVADMDFECPPKIVEAMYRVADHKIYGYTMNLTDPRYLDSIVDWYKRRYDTELNPEHILYSTGSITGINHAINCFSNVGDGVLICRPVYGHFTGMIEDDTYRKVVNCDLVNDGKGYYTIDWVDFEEKCSRATTRIFILCHPANPVGRVWTKGELKKMAEICKRHKVLIISDEIHSDIVRGGIKHHPIVSVVEDLSNIIMVIGINKSFNVAGLHCSNVVIPDDNLRGIFSKDYGMKMPSPFTVAACIAAYDECEDWLDALNEYIDGTIDWVLDFTKKNMPKLKIHKPEGTYMLWLDFTDYKLSDDEVHKKIYINANVLLQDGIVHDPDKGECFQRVCLGAPRSIVKEAFERIAREFK